MIYFEENFKTHELFLIYSIRNKIFQRSLEKVIFKCVNIFRMIYFEEKFQKLHNVFNI